MTNRRQALNLLSSLYRHANRGQVPTIPSICNETGLETSVVVALLGALDRAGLVDSRRPSLTLAGLAVAVAAKSRARSHAYCRAA